MVLLFLGNWRSTLIIALTIPLSILASILVLHDARRDAEPDDARRPRALGRHPGRPGDRDDREHRAPPAHGHSRSSEAILVGAGEIGVPAFVSTLCICIVFVPMFFLSGVARFLFVPLAEAVVFAMIASYILSRTLVPTLVMLLMRGTHGEARRRPRAAEPAAARLPRLRPPVRARARAPTPWCSSALLAQARRASASAFLAFCLLSCAALSGARARLLPERRRRPDPPAPARADRHAHRGDRAPGRRGRGGDPRAGAEGPARDHPRQPRRAEQRHQPLVQQRRHDRHARRRDPDVAEGRATGRPRSS